MHQQLGVRFLPHFVYIHWTLMDQAETGRFQLSGNAHGTCKAAAASFNHRFLYSGSGLCRDIYIFISYLVYLHFHELFSWFYLYRGHVGHLLDVSRPIYYWGEREAAGTQPSSKLNAASESCIHCPSSSSLWPPAQVPCTAIRPLLALLRRGSGRRLSRARPCRRPLLTSCSKVVLLSY
jgi:hypothetical protein